MMNHKNFNTIDPSQIHIPNTAIIQKVLSDGDKQATEQHEKAVRAFFVADGIASGIGKDLAFVDKIPSFIKEIIDDKLWECLYVAKGVVTPYYCRYTKGTDSENFRVFITAKRPNGLETSVETLDRVLQADPEVQRKFRAIIYESRQGQRTDLSDETSRSDCGKLDNLGSRQKESLRAANRAAEAIPEVAELLDRGLIAIDIAAQLGHDIKDPENLTAEEREYVDKRDLIGTRIRQYININKIPEDEDREPAYSRELNKYVKDLLGIKDRSKSVRMDNPKKAAEKLLQFYQRDGLQDLITHLTQGLNLNIEPCEATREHSNQLNDRYFTPTTLPSTDIGDDSAVTEANKNQSVCEEVKSKSEEDKLDTCTEAQKRPEKIDYRTSETASNYEIPENEVTQLNYQDVSMELTADELAERWNTKSNTVTVMWNKYKNTYKFHRWSQKQDPEHVAWERTDKKKGRSWLFIPVAEVS
jgi:hypothetical protein